MDWPWMKDATNADPAPHDDDEEDDNRPIVSTLIQQHREKINAVARGLQDDPLYQPDTKHDDLWILRFCLSHKSTKKALKAAKHTLQYRKKHKLDTMDIRHVPPQRITQEDHIVKKFSKYVKPGGYSAFVCHPRGVVAYIDAGSVKGRLMVEELPESLWEEYFGFLAEWSFQWVDYMTRTSGRLTKSIRFMDFSTFQMSGVSLENTRRTGNAMNVLEDCYPQLLESFFVTNAPGWMQTPWNAIRPVLPQRMVAKVDFLRPASNPKHRKRLDKYIAHEDLPQFLGGGNPTPMVDL